jgi:hypothetical protein
MKNWNDCTKAQQVERWENVLRVLRALTPHERREHWNMARWGVETDCGTVACAAGHCGLDTWFRRRGLILEPAAGVFGSFRGFKDGGGMAGGAVATQAFFGHTGCRSIFWNNMPRPVSDVIKEVRAYIKTLQAIR